MPTFTKIVSLIKINTKKLQNPKIFVHNTFWSVLDLIENAQFLWLIMSSSEHLCPFWLVYFIYYCQIYIFNLFGFLLLSFLALTSSHCSTVRDFLCSFMFIIADRVYGSVYSRFAWKIAIKSNMSLSIVVLNNCRFCSDICHTQAKSVCVCCVSHLLTWWWRHNYLML